MSAVKQLAALVVVAILSSAAASAKAQEACTPEGLFGSRPSTFNFRYENDHFAGQDQGYSSGLRWQFGSRDVAHEACDPGSVTLARHVFGWTLPANPDELNLLAGVEHQVYTPSDRLRTDVILDDRPYAAWLFTTWGMRARTGNQLVRNYINIGVVGPAAGGEQVQNFIHRILGRPRFNGWDNQLHNELGLQWVYDHAYRIELRPQSRVQIDAIPHWGGSLGNVATYAEAGSELRIGPNLPDDFGRIPVSAAKGDAGLRPYFFVSVDGRLVLHDIFLDGNTFGDSQSVDKKSVVGEYAYGVAMYIGNMKVSFTRLHRTREFDGQKELPSYGSLNFTQSF
jgi:hypothetical protein